MRIFVVLITAIVAYVLFGLHFWPGEQYRESTIRVNDSEVIISRRTSFQGLDGNHDRGLRKPRRTGAEVSISVPARNWHAIWKVSDRTQEYAIAVTDGAIFIASISNPKSGCYQLYVERWDESEWVEETDRERLDSLPWIRTTHTTANIRKIPLNIFIKASKTLPAVNLDARVQPLNLAKWSCK